MKRLITAATLLVISGCSQAGDDTMTQQQDECCLISFKVTVPEGTGDVYLTGNLDSLGPWQADAARLEGATRSRSLTLQIPADYELEYKFTLGSWDREAVGPSGMVMGNHTLTVTQDQTVSHDIPDFKKDVSEYMADIDGADIKGTLIYWPDVESEFLGPTRHVSIWLPTGYDESGERRYPVLYMHDGQNLFDPRIANTGMDWGVDEAITRLAEAGTIEAPIVVSTWSTNERGVEYSPWHKAPDFARFLTEELMPRVDAEFRTKTGPEDTAVMGSSMGGLLSFYLIRFHSDEFGACGCISTHFPLSERVAAEYFAQVPFTGDEEETPYILREIEAGETVPSSSRMWFDYGTEGLDAAYGPTHEAVREWLFAQGFIEGEDFVIREYEGADHNERSWRARLEDPLIFLFGY